VLTTRGGLRRLVTPVPTAHPTPEEPDDSPTAAPTAPPPLNGVCNETIVVSGQTVPRFPDLLFCGDLADGHFSIDVPGCYNNGDCSVAVVWERIQYRPPTGDVPINLISLNDNSPNSGVFNCLADPFCQSPRTFFTNNANLEIIQDAPQIFPSFYCYDMDLRLMEQVCTSALPDVGPLPGLFCPVDPVDGGVNFVVANMVKVSGLGEHPVGEDPEEEDTVSYENEEVYMHFVGSLYVSGAPKGLTLTLLHSVLPLVAVFALIHIEFLHV